MGLLSAQCLYVLTDDNEPAIVTLKSDAGYISCLLSIAQPPDESANGKGKDLNDHRQITLRVLSSGEYWMFRRILVLITPL